MQKAQKIPQPSRRTGSPVYLKVGARFIEPVCYGADKSAPYPFSTARRGATSHTLQLTSCILIDKLINNKKRVDTRSTPTYGQRLNTI